MNWHIESIKETEHRVRTDIENGLTQEEAERRLVSFGGNIIGDKKHLSFRQRIGRQLSAFLVVILLSAACISLVVAVNSFGFGNWLESVIVSALAVLYAVALAVFEQSSDDARVRLLSVSESECRVIRDSKYITVPAATLVPGDIIQLGAGDIIPADARLCECTGMHCDESVIGGETLSCLKDANAEPDITALISERANLVYAGCVVLSGTAHAIVTETGADTEYGKQARLLDSDDERNTPVKQQIGVMGKNLALTGLIVTFVVFIAGFASRHPNDIKAIEVFMTAAALAVAGIPECVPVIVDYIRMKCTLAMAEKGAVARDPDVLEHLGCVSVICTDKSAVVEKKRMSLQRLWTPGGRICTPSKRAPDESGIRLLEYAALCTEGKKAGAARRPADNAIISCLLGLGIRKRSIDSRYPKAVELPFDTHRRLMITVHHVGDTIVAMVKGSPERILPMCVGCEEGSDLRTRADAICLRMGEEALQVLAVACIELDVVPEDTSWIDTAQGLSFVGMLGFNNHLDSEAATAVRECERAGIRVVMISGDQASTARAVALKTGILKEGEEVLTSAQMAQLSDEELENSLRKYSVFASMSSEDKLRIIKAWQSSGEVVAVTGSSVDDVPALHCADIGCTMGLRGADAAKGCADITITDDSLATVVNAVRDGRRSYRSISCCVQYLLTCSMSVMSVAAACVLISGTLPMLPVHLLMYLLLAVLIPAACFYAEPHSDVMDTQPRLPDRRFFTTRFIIDTLLYGAGIALLGATAFFIGRSVSIDSARTMVFGVLTLSLIVHAISSRTRDMIYTAQFYANKDTLLTAFIAAAVTLLLLIAPREELFLVPLTAGQWTVVLTLSAAPLVGGELIKLLRRCFGGHIITGIEG